MGEKKLYRGITYDLLKSTIPTTPIPPKKAGLCRGRARPYSTQIVIKF